MTKGRLTLCLSTSVPQRLSALVYSYGSRIPVSNVNCRPKSTHPGLPRCNAVELCRVGGGALGLATSLIEYAFVKICLLTSVSNTDNGGSKR